MRIQFDRVVTLLERGIVVTLVIPHHGQIARDDGRDRVEGRSLPHLGGGRREIVERHQTRHGIPVMRGRIAWVERQCLKKLVLGPQPVPVLSGSDMRQRRPRLG